MNRISAAQHALLVIYAFDMCALSPSSIPPGPDPRIAESGLNIIGYISASDDIAKSGASLRAPAQLGASGDDADRVCYGYLAQDVSGNGKFVVAIRGTDGVEEWVDDLDCLMTKHSSQEGGYVDQGFWSIYRTMCLHTVDDAGIVSAAVPVVSGIQAAIGINPVMVLGHSLGATLASYLALDLNLVGCNASGCMFASPRPGNATFAEFFDQTVSNYDVFDFELDVVPKWPKFDIFHLTPYVTLPQAKTIAIEAANLSINDNPACSHHLICYAALLDEATYQGAMGDALCTMDDSNCARCIVVG